MRISVIMPVYNQFIPLKLTLYGFDKQTYPKDEFEVIVVDDGSKEPVELNQEDYNFSLTVIRQENSGRSAARNRGIMAAKGDLIVFNDADRIPDSIFLEEHARFHEKANRLVVVGRPNELYISNIEEREEEIKKLIDNGRVQRFSRSYQYDVVISNLYSNEGKTTSKIPWISFFSGNASVRKEVLLESDMFDTSFKSWGVEHFEFGFRLYSHGVSFEYAKGAKNNHLVHARDSSFYKKNFKESVQLFSDLHKDEKIMYLYQFLIGEVSLQQLEEHFIGSKDSIHSIQEVFFKSLQD